MSKIRILPEHLANQIAAGEVVERPASVVKELVENAIDAGAGRITVEIEGGGSRLIRVIDDGEGMDQDDLLLALERHATSKLREAGELSRIMTLGFRGEAIPSIASVSRLTITSRTAEAALGSRAEVRFGQLQKVHEMGASCGTVMEVRDLFGNVPARRKFLKSARTELAHIDEVLVNLALAMPRLGFSLGFDGRQVRSFAPAGEGPASRVREIMGRQASEALIEVAGKSAELQLHGYLLPPDESGSAAARLRIFVNRRPVRDRIITHAVTEGLHNFLLKGRGPAGVLFLTVSPELVDVNVHPAKQEIRFQRPQDIHQQVAAAVSHAMQTFQREMQHAVFGRLAQPTVGSEGPSEQASRHFNVYEPPADKGVVNEQRFNSFSVQEPAPVEARANVPAFQRSSVSVTAPIEAGGGKPAQPALQLPGQESTGRLKYAGQFMNSYLLCETEGGIAIVDQHAAHERLLFEALKKQYAAREMPSQSLLFPEIIECTPEQVEVLQQFGDEIAGLGLIIQEFGGQSFVIKAVPAMLGHLGPREIVNGVFDHFLHREGRGKEAARRLEDVLAVMACKAAVKARDPLRPEEGEALLRRMEEADIFSHCPHGRPVLKLFSEAEVRRWFHRS